MANTKFLDYSGLNKLVEKIKNTYSTKTELTTHTNNKSNPHGVTKAQLGLDKVDNTADSSKSVASAAKLTTTRTINGVSFDGSKNVSGAFTSGLYESYLNWGGKNFSGYYGPIDACLAPMLGANRFAFGKPAGITITYSRDGGSTWTDYGASDTAKQNLFSPPGGDFAIGKNDSNNKATAQYMLRVAISTSAFGLYTVLNKFILYISTNGSTGCYCTVDASLQSTPTTFKTFIDKAPISGWSGYNVLNCSDLCTYGNTPSGQYGIVRFTFGCTGGSTTYNGLRIYKIYGFGGIGWNTPSTLAGQGTVYSIGSGQNVSFPAAVTASSFTKSGGSASQLLRADGGIATFNWSGQSGQPTWLWGGSSQHTYYVYNPSNFNVNSATKLTTARSINGTSFNGTSDITTANWGTARTLTIGNSGKSINGSANISWSLSEIGAAASSHTHTFASLTSKPTTLSGYGITDAAASSHSHSNASTSAAGFMSTADKSKLDGIATGANNYTLPTATSSTLGGIRTGFVNYGEKYSLELDGSSQAYVHVPIKDTYATKAELQEAVDGLTPDPDEYNITYGVQFDTTVSSPTCTRIGNTDFHKTLPVHSKIRGCLLDNDGNVVEYLNEKDWNDPPKFNKDDTRVFLPDGTVTEAVPVNDCFPSGMWEGGFQPGSWEDILSFEPPAVKAGNYYIYQIEDPTGSFTKLVYYNTDDDYQDVFVDDTQYYVVADENSYGGEVCGVGYIYQHLFKVEACDYGTEWKDLGYFNGRRDGLRGQVMIEIPKHYRRFDTDGTKRRVRISTINFKGSHEVPKMYVSAYQATVDRTNLKLASVANTTAQFRGGNNNASYDGTYRSLLGVPASVISRTNFRKYARNRKANSSEWNCMTYDAQKTLYWLFVTEYATLNSQAAYNAQLTSEGYRQGGLGAGVTTWDWDSWGTYNGVYPFVKCGHTDSLGNNTGVVALTVSNGSDITKTFDVSRYRGVENPFGHIWQWTDGINVRVGASAENGGTGLSEVFVCSDPSKFNDTGYDGYSHVGNEERNGGYVKEVIFGEYGEIMPLLAGGGSTTYFCDNHYVSIPSSGSALRGVPFGGAANYGASAGFVYAYTTYAPSATSMLFGSRLCFVPDLTKKITN